MYALLVLLGLLAILAGVVFLIWPKPMAKLGRRKGAGALIVAGLVGFFVGGDMLPPAPAATAAATVAPKAAPVAPSAPAADAPSSYKVGDLIDQGPIAYGVASVKTARSVGRLAPQRAADGGVYVVVSYVVMNRSRQPVSAFKLPRVKLIDANGVVYSEDAGATGSYALGRDDMNQKLWSDLNPGLTVHSAEVFEVASSAYDPKTWKVVFGDDDARVAISS